MSWTSVSSWLLVTLAFGPLACGDEAGSAGPDGDVTEIAEVFTPDTTFDTSPPETTGPETATPETTAPETTPETTTPETTAPETTTPDTVTDTNVAPDTGPVLEDCDNDRDDDGDRAVDCDDDDCAADRACAAPPCGDGVVGEGEVCDGSALANGCSAGASCADDCTSCFLPAPICGDGQKNGGEQCDPSDPSSKCAATERCVPPGSAAACTCEAIPATCGDGDVDADETCDASAAVTGCDAGYTCDRCETCYTCGDGEVGGTEACDLVAGMFGDIGSCGDDQTCSSGCQCQDVTTVISDFDVRFTAQTAETVPCSGAADCAGIGDETCGPDGLCSDETGAAPARVISVFGLPVSFTAEITGTPEDIADFNLIWVNADGEALEVTDFVSDSDLLLDSRFDDHGDGTFAWHFTVHFLVSDFDPIADFAALVVYDAEGNPSNLEFADNVDDPDYLGPLGEGESGCDDAAFYSQCDADFECVAGTCEAGADGDFAFAADGFVADLAGDTVTLQFVFGGTDLAVMSSYALVLFAVDLDGDGLFDLAVDDVFGGFFAFDDGDGDGQPDADDNGDGTFTATLTFTDMAARFDEVYPAGEAELGDLLSIGAEIYDVSEKAYAEVSL